MNIHGELPLGYILLSTKGRIVRSWDCNEYKNNVMSLEDQGKSLTVHGKIVEVTASSPHSYIRQVVKWGTYGKDGTDPLTYVKVADMTVEHLEACLRTQNLSPRVKKIMTDEINQKWLYESGIHDASIKSRS